MKTEIIDYIQRNRVSSTEVADCMNKTGALPRVNALNRGHFCVGNVFWAYACDASNWSVHEQVEKGVVRCIGCSNFSGVQLRQALDISSARGLSRFEFTQPPYNLAQYQAQEDVFPLCREEELAATPYSPLGAGFLAGKYGADRSKFPKGSRFDVIPGHADEYFSERNFRIVEKLRQKARDSGASMVRLAMAWAMTHPDVTSVLVGARKVAHIENALEAMELGLGTALRDEMSQWG